MNKSIAKRFSPSLHKKYDKLARDNVKKIFSKLKKYEIQDNPKTVGVDLLVYKGGEHIFNVECEVKNVWVGNKGFPYDSVQFPERKLKYSQLDKPTLYVMFNKDQSEYLVVKGEDLVKSPLVMVRNKYVRFGEMFYQVPLKKVVMNNIESLIKDLEE